MKVALEYRGQSIVETDEGPLGHPEGTWILCKSLAGWHVCCTGEAGTVHPYSGAQAVASREAAWQELCRFIDAELMSFATMDRAQDFVPEVMHYAVDRDVKAGGYRLWAPVDSVKANISIELLMKVHNGLSIDDPLRFALQQELKAQGKYNLYLAGIVISQSGDLVYDEARAVAAHQRHKLKRHVEAVQSNLSKLADDLQFVLGSAAEERSAMAKVADAVVPLLDLEPVSPAARALTAVEMPLLEVLGGIAKYARTSSESPISRE